MLKPTLKNKLTTLAFTSVTLSLLTFGAGAANAAKAAPSGKVSTCPSVVTPLSQAEMDEAIFMREEEKLARDVYDELAAYWLAQSGTLPVVTIMNNVSDSEQTHMDSMKDVLSCYGLPDPVDTAETPGVFLDTELARLYTDLTTQGQLSPLEALKVGALIEEVDIEDLQDSIEISQQDYTDAVYANLMCGSRNHLRAFAGEIIKIEGHYTAQVLDQDMVDAIVDSANERCAAASQSLGHRGGR